MMIDTARLVAHELNKLEETDQWRAGPGVWENGGDAYIRHGDGVGLHLRATLPPHGGRIAISGDKVDMADQWPRDDHYSSLKPPDHGGGDSRSGGYRERHRAAPATRLPGSTGAGTGSETAERRLPGRDG